MSDRTKILIFGGSGLLGYCLAQKPPPNTEIILAYNSRRSPLTDVQQLKFAVDEDADVVGFITDLKPDIVINAIALTSVESCEASWKASYQTNTVTARLIAQACHSANRKLVHISTDHLSDGRLSFVTEDEAVSLLNNYAKTKYVAEIEALRFCPGSIVLRTCFFGIGPYYRPSLSDRIIGDLVANATLNMFENVYLNPVYAPTIGQVVVSLVAMNAQGIFNLGTKDRSSNFDLAQKIAIKFGFDQANIQKVRYTANGDLKKPESRSLDCKKLQATLGNSAFELDHELDKLRDDSLSIPSTSASYIGQKYRCK